MKKLSHVNSEGKAEMVDISGKTETLRTATASAEVFVSKEVFNRIKRNTIEKGDVLAIAKFAGIQAAKKTYELIPLCHNIPISKVNVDIKLNSKNNSLLINTFAKTFSKTGIEMETLAAASVAALTIYDMCKALDKSIKINNIRLTSKTGGKSGDYKVS